MNRKRIVVSTATVTCLMLAVSAWSGLLTSIIIPTTGNVSTFTPSADIEVYNDEACTDPCTSHAWGTIYNGTSKTKAVYVLNGGNIPVTLVLSTSEWTPTIAESEMMLSWNYDDSPLASEAVKEIRLTLFIKANATSTPFSFNIIITGEGS